MKNLQVILFLSAISVACSAIVQNEGRFLPIDIMSEDEVLLQHEILDRGEAILDNEVILDNKADDVKGKEADLVGHNTKIDVLLMRNLYTVGHYPNIQHTRYITAKGNAYLSIERVRVSYVGGPQNTDAWIKGGGLGYNFVTVMLQSQMSRGYSIRIEIWGR